MSESKTSSQPFVALWRQWEERAKRNGPHHTIFWVEKDPDHERSKRECAIGAKPVPKFRTGSTYAGEWDNNKKNGFGSQVWSNGKKYQGDWKNGVRDGVGTLWVMKKGKLRKRYAGNWKDNKKHGTGLFFADDGSKYEGEWIKGKRNGKGRTTYTNGDIYEGEFFNDARSGFGKLIHPNGNFYEGNWHNDEKEGAGRYFYAATNKVYTGEWVAGFAKCGSYEDWSQDDADHREAQVFTLPELCLEDSNKVLWECFSNTRKRRTRELGELEAKRREDEEAKGEEYETTTTTGVVHKTVFTREEVCELEKAFNAVDTERHGIIIGSQLVLVLNELGIFPLDEDVSQLLEELGADEESQISLHEFIGLLATLRT